MGPGDWCRSSTRSNNHGLQKSADCYNGSKTNRLASASETQANKRSERWAGDLWDERIDCVAATTPLVGRGIYSKLNLER